MDSKQKDFTISLVLIAVALWALIGGIGIYLKAARPPYSITRLSISPGLLPIILGALLLVLSSVLFIKSAREIGLKNGFLAIVGWGKGAVKNSDIRSMVIGMLIMAVYGFLLIGKLPYWATALIYLVAIMVYLRASKFWKIVVISCAVVGAIILLFQVGFNVSLP